MVTARLKGGKAATQELDATSKAQIALLLEQTGVRTVLLPVKFGNTHWCCLVVDLQQRRVVVYDSMNSDLYTLKLEKLTRHVAVLAPSELDIVRVNSPRQCDGYSCGFFVCLKFWHTVDLTVSRDLSDSGCLTPCFRLANLLLSSSVIV